MTEQAGVLILSLLNELGEDGAAVAEEYADVIHQAQVNPAIKDWQFTSLRRAWDCLIALQSIKGNES